MVSLVVEDHTGHNQRHRHIGHFIESGLGHPIDLELEALPAVQPYCTVQSQGITGHSIRLEHRIGNWCEWECIGRGLDTACRNGQGQTDATKQDTTKQRPDPLYTI